METPAGARVLIVEDDDLLRTVLGRMLAVGGLVPVEAESGEGALARLREAPVDVALLDGLLPDMHGLQLARQMLDDPATAHIPICLVSGSAGADDGVRAGIAALMKPVRPAELVECIGVLLRWRDGGGSPLPERHAALDRLARGFAVGF